MGNQIFSEGQKDYKHISKDFKSLKDFNYFGILRLSQAL